MWEFKLMIFYLSILILSLFYICLFWKVEIAYMSSLNGWKVWFLKDPHFGARNFLSNFIFPSYLLVYPEIAMCLAYTSKKCEFWHPYLRGIPIVVLSNFVNFYLFIFVYSEKFHQSRVSGAVLNFGVFVWREFFHLGTPKFCQIL